MKREEFLITSTEGHKAIKYKWNSARREVISILQEDECSSYELVNITTKKDQRGLHISGVEVWKDHASGREISFFITKTA